MDKVKSVSNKLMRNLPLLLGVLILSMDVIALLAPILAKLKVEAISDGIYFVYSFLCHQRPWRSLHIFDYQVAWCTRDTFIYLSMGLSALFVNKFKIRKVKWYIPLIAVIPFAADGLLQLFAEFKGVLNDKEVYFYASTNFIRMLTGSIFGTGAGLWVFSLLDETIEEEMQADKVENVKKTVSKMSWKTGFGLIFSICVIFYLGFIQLWRVTSNDYPPAGFVDNKRYFPGYNYEVTERCGHC